MLFWFYRRSDVTGLSPRLPVKSQQCTRADGRRSGVRISIVPRRSSRITTTTGGSPRNSARKLHAVDLGESVGSPVRRVSGGETRHCSARITIPRIPPSYFILYYFPWCVLGIMARRRPSVIDLSRARFLRVRHDADVACSRANNLSVPDLTAEIDESGMTIWLRFRRCHAEYSQPVFDTCVLAISGTLKWCAQERAEAFPI